jgi:peptide-methionine (S)-S-oxide reductase
MITKIVLGGGCFWCIEAVFGRVRGVISAVSGYAGGEAINPTYQQVCSGQTGHTEVVEVSFDDSEVSLEQLLDIFFEIHDPTTLNRQGNDVGTQYRSAIYFTTTEQARLVKQYVQNLQNLQKFNDPIITEIKPIDIFYKGESIHQDYYNQNSTQGYCRVVIEPKLQKLIKRFAKLAK